MAELDAAIDRNVAFLEMNGVSMAPTLRIAVLRYCVLAIVISYVLAAATWLMPRTVVGLTDDATGIILARIATIADILGPTAALMAFLLWISSDSPYGSWWLPVWIVLGFLILFLIPAIATS